MKTPATNRLVELDYITNLANRIFDNYDNIPPKINSLVEEIHTNVLKELKDYTQEDK